VLTASWDNTARLWEAETGMLMATGKLLATFQGHTGAVNRRISADSSFCTCTTWENKT